MEKNGVTVIEEYKMIRYHHYGVDVFLFRIGLPTDSYKLEKEYQLHDLTPVTTKLLEAINEYNPDFAKKYPNATQCKNERGTWDMMECGGVYMGSERFNVDGKGARAWGGYWWFAGCKS